MTARSVSVVLPVYNGARSLRESVASVLAQRHSDVELPAWGDGSSDGSAEVVAAGPPLQRPVPV